MVANVPALAAHELNLVDDEQSVGPGGWGARRDAELPQASLREHWKKRVNDIFFFHLLTPNTLLKLIIFVMVFLSNKLDHIMVLANTMPYFMRGDYCRLYWLS